MFTIRSRDTRLNLDTSFPTRASWFAGYGWSSYPNSSWTANTSQAFGGYYAAVGGSDGDEYIQYISLRAGVYDVNVLGLTSNGQCKVDYYLDGNLISSGQDWYSASTVYNVVKTISMIVNKSGMHALKVKVNGKTGANYRFAWNYVWISPSVEVY